MIGKIQEGLIMHERLNYKVIRGVVSGDFIAYPTILEGGFTRIDRENGIKVDETMWKKSLPVEY